MELVEKVTRFQYMDLMRFILASTVMFFHYFYWSDIGYHLTSSSPEILQKIFVNGRLGVPLFFVISGFVILYTANNKGVGDFLISRISRLLPGIMIVSIIGYISYLFLPSPIELQPLNIFLLFTKFFRFNNTADD